MSHCGPYTGHGAVGSMPFMDARLYAYLSYRDAPSALSWMEAIGFVLVRRHDTLTGSVAHAEVRMGDAVVIVSSAEEGHERPSPADQSTGAGLYLQVTDVDDLYRRALSAGARSVIAPENTEWGGRRVRVLDPGGQEWTAGTYAPGQYW